MPDEIETIDKNPKSWAAWKREAERLQAIIDDMVLAAMDSESGCLPLDYLQGHKDGLEWAARLAEANHPGTGDWLYDDPIELAKAIRKGPDMPPVQPAPVVPEEWTIADAVKFCKETGRQDAGAAMDAWNACRAAMLQAGNSPAQSDCCPAQSDCCPAQNQGWIPVSEQMPEVGDIVLTAMGGVVNVGETECSAANCRFFTSVISGRELPATHWMPLPAAPQEVKGE